MNQPLDLIYYSDKITIINPHGHIGILTLWSRVDVMLKQLGELPASVAAISNFYGDGINQLLVNLLNNPQISVLHVTGTNRANSLEDLISFFDNGVEDVKVGGVVQRRIRGTTRLLNAAITGPDMFIRKPKIVCHKNAADLKQSLDTEPIVSNFDRKRVELVEQSVDQFPSIRHGHQIVGTNSIDAWRELLFTIVRFGQPTQLAKGSRRELYNVKVVINDVAWPDDSEYVSVNLEKDRMHKYAKQIIDGVLPDDASYTYGHRLRTYFGRDMLNIVIGRLSCDQEDRKCYISLWDPSNDLSGPTEADRSTPCWVGAFWRIVPVEAGFQLLMSAIFRTHRAYTAWIENVHGLTAINSLITASIKEKLCIDIVPGPLTVYSQSISVEPLQLPMVEGVIGGRKWSMRDDNRGQLTFSIVDDKIVVEHKLNGMLLKRYEGKRAEIISHQLALDCVISDLGHSLYVGRQLGKLEMCIKHGIEYYED